MNREETAEAIKVMQHFVDWGFVQRRERGDKGRWSDEFTRQWNWGEYEYRIALPAEQQAIVDAWEADKDSVEYWSSAFQEWTKRENAPLAIDHLKAGRYRIKPSPKVIVRYVRVSNGSIESAIRHSERHDFLAEDANQFTYLDEQEVK